MEFFVNYFLLGLFLSAIATWIQYSRYYPHAEIVPMKFLLSWVIWPVYVLAVPLDIINKGWNPYE